MQTSTSRMVGRQIRTTSRVAGLGVAGLVATLLAAACAGAAGADEGRTTHTAALEACTTMELGSPTDCVPAAIWQAMAADACAAEGLEVGMVEMGVGCASGRHRGVVFECCPAVEPACEELVLGGPDQCVPEVAWPTMATEACAGLGMDLAGLTLETLCARGRYRVAHVTCCTSEPSGCTAHEVGGPGQCRPQSWWADLAATTCQSGGLAVSDLTLAAQCASGRFLGATFDCCPDTPVEDVCCFDGAAWSVVPGDACPSTDALPAQACLEEVCCEVGDGFGVLPRLDCAHEAEAGLCQPAGVRCCVLPDGYALMPSNWCQAQGGLPTIEAMCLQEVCCYDGLGWGMTTAMGCATRAWMPFEFCAEEVCCEIGGAATRVPRELCPEAQEAPAELCQGSADCGDGVCDPTFGEGCVTCPADCGECAIGTCADLVGCLGGCLDPSDEGCIQSCAAASAPQAIDQYNAWAGCVMELCPDGDPACTAAVAYDGACGALWQACVGQPACAADSDCAAGELCVAGVCQGGCTSNADCTGDESCLGGLCVPAP